MMGRYDDWEDESYEPGYDAGPEAEHQCSECGEEVLESELTDDGCLYCEDSDEESYGPDYHDGPRFTGEPGFADPGGNSALRAASESNPRVHPCPNCGSANRLTPADVARSYQCDPCADRAEQGGY